MISTVSDQTDQEQPASPLTREQLYDRIMALNPTASVAFLAEFGEHLLRNYLDHLVSAQEPRGRFARWPRPGDAPAIVVRISA